MGSFWRGKGGCGPFGPHRHPTVQNQKSSCLCYSKLEDNLWWNRKAAKCKIRRGIHLKKGLCASTIKFCRGSWDNRRCRKRRGNNLGCVSWPWGPLTGLAQTKEVPCKIQVSTRTTPKIYSLRLPNEYRRDRISLLGPEIQSTVMGAEAETSVTRMNSPLEQNGKSHWHNRFSSRAWWDALRQ